jgi:hypothetical protein
MRWDVAQLTRFCEAGEYEVSLVPGGTLLTPPTKNEFDRDAFSRLMTPDEYSEARAKFERMFEE